VRADLMDRAAAVKEKLRSELGKRLRAKSAPVAAGRSSDCCGPGGTGSLPGEVLVEPMAAGRAGMWFREALAHALG